MSQQNKQTPLPPPNGQALVEYSLILVLVILGFGLALAATGPTIANVFSNTVFNLVSRENEKIPTVMVNGTSKPQLPPEVDAFWKTVTAVANYIPVEIPLPTSTPAPLTFTPSPGPPPSATKTLVPSPTVPSSTPEPTNTPTDLAVKAPWTDTANDKNVWRLDEIDPMGPEDWYGTYYTGTTLSGTIFLEGFNADLDPSKKQIIDYNWGNNGPTQTQTDSFSVAWTRNIYLAKNMQITFSIPRADDAVRVWIEGGAYGSSFPACSSTYVSGVWVTNSDTKLGYNSVTDPSGAGIPTDCLISGNWNGNSSTGPGTFTRTIKAGNYKLHVDYQEKTGSAYASVGVSNNTNLANPDDALLDSAGNPVTYVDTSVTPNKTVNAAANCDWGNPPNLENFADTPTKLWTGYKTGNDAPNFLGSRRCYLEFRGSIEIPDAVTLPNPTLTFWDLWDFPAGTTAWVEVAEYTGNNNRATWVWEKFPLHTGDNFNYNWTYQTIALGPKYSGKLIALRFGLENRDTAKKSRWWVDSIVIDTVERSTFYTAQTWNLDNKEEALDFIASGNWGLTTENMMSASGFAWHESPGSNYKDMNYERPSMPSTADNNFRIHSLEFNGIIDLSDPLGAPDEDGDNGNQELTFYHSYDLANYTGLEVQYAAVTDLATAFGTAPVVWKTFTGSTLVPRTGSGTATLAVAEQKRLSLKAIADTGVTKFRLRFAMLVDKDSSNDKSGWWIDNIRLERVDAPRFSPYPFEDDMDTDASDKAWVSLGTWGREEGGQAPKTGKGYSWTDSPKLNYADNDTTALELRYPMDLRADTLTNPRSPKCTLGAGICNDAAHQDKAAINPLMTFWWKRDLGQTDTLFLEWKLKSESAWRVDPLWVYKDGMVTVGNGSNGRTRTSVAWERVEVDLTPVMTGIGPDNAGSDSEDDIVFRFKFVTNASSNGPGIWIDNVDLRDRNDQIWKLWPTGESRKDVANVVIGNGNGLQYVNSGEDLQVFPPEWFIGGNWSAIDFERHDGLTAFHDSAVVNYGTPQTAAEIGNGDTGFVATQGDTFNVLEMNKIFDLRATLAVEKPLMYFWHRYAVPAGSTISVQVAEEKPAGTGVTCRDSYTQCYEKMYQWKDWKTIWSVTGDKSNLAWTREQVDLVQFAQNGTTAGKRIRIRFVMDALDKNSTDRDGWYIDQVAVMHYPDRRIPISASSSFVDYSTDMTNWVDEGKWGLDPEVFKGGGGIPISIGDYWVVNYWNMTSAMCTAIGGGADTNNQANFRNCVNAFFSPPTTNEPKRAQSTVYKRNTGGIPPTIPNRIEIDIFHEWGNSGPTSGATTYSDKFAARFELTTGLVGAPGKAKGLITFIMASDEGARLKYMNEIPGSPATLTTTDACTGKNTTCGNEWNIIDHFSPHGRSVTVGSAFLAPVGSLKPDLTQINNTSGIYRFIVEYYDFSGSAVLTLATGTDTFSFSDTPKQGAGPGFPDIPALYKASSSLLLNGVLDLTTAVKPYMTYSTVYELGGTARVEVSIDGGFTWTDAGLSGNVNSKWADATWNVDMWYNNTLDFVTSGTGPARNHNFTTANLNYNWGTGIAINGKSDDFSLRFTRKINLTIADELNLRTEADDGVRLWIYKVGDNSPQTGTVGCPTFSNNFMRSGQPITNNGSATFTSGCLLIDNWKAQGATTHNTTFKPATAGQYVIQLDYFEVNGGAQVKLDVSPGNFDLPYYGGTQINPANWIIKTHDLSDYQGQRIGLRFRLDRLSETGDDRTTGNGYLNSWWLTEIGIFSN